jgi:hypothetical protein
MGLRGRHFNNKRFTHIDTREWPFNDNIKNDYGTSKRAKNSIL